MVKVLFVIDGLWVGGTERSTAELLPVLAERGVDVSVVCLRERSEGVESGVRSSGVKIDVLPPGALLPQVRSLRRILRSEGPDIVHSALYRANLVTRLAAIGLRVTVVNSLVNTPYEPVRFDDPNLVRWKLELTRLLDELSGRLLTDSFHAVSNSVAASAREHLRLPARKLVVVGRGRDRKRLGQPSPERRARTRDSLGVNGEAPVIVTVGRQDYQKGYGYLLDALEQVGTHIPSVVSLLVGRSGSATGALQERLEGTELGDRVRILGHREDVPDLLTAADLYVTTSLFEGMPGVVIEAMAMGLPVVGFDIAPVQEVVEPGRSALLCEVGDAAALADMIETVLNDPDLRDSMGERGRAIYEERFTLGKSADAMVRFYAGLGDR